MDIYKNIKLLSQDFEKKLQTVLEEIEKQKRLIIFNAQQEALIILREAKQVREEIIDRTIRQSHHYLKNIKQKTAKELEANQLDMDW